MSYKFLDDRCYALTENNPNMYVPWFLMACYAYENGKPIISDSCFDVISEKMYENWKNIKHMHKKLIKHDANNASKKGSSVDVKRYPNLVKDATTMLIRELESEK